MAPRSGRSSARRGRASLNLSALRRVRRALSVSDTEDGTDSGRRTASTSRRPATRSTSTKERPRASSLKADETPSMARPQQSSRSTGNVKGNKKRKAKTSRTANTSSKKRKTAHSTTNGGKEPQPKAKIEAPDWPLNLPYEILLQIFQCAAYPLVNENYYGTASVAWLVQMARMRRDFTEPALAALYYSPPLLPASRAHGLLAHLESQKEYSIINYRTKVRYLDVEALHVLTLKHAGQGAVDLKKLVAVCPQVRGISIDLHVDRPGSLQPARRANPVYDHQFFDELDAAQISLRQFKWNYYVAPRANVPWSVLSIIHDRPSFSNVRELEIAHCGDPYKLTLINWRQLRQELIQAFGSLKNLKELTFTKCRLGAEETLLENTSQLQALRFIDCDDLESAYLGLLLQRRGSTLSELVLKHNRYLDLSFSHALAADCPTLETLVMDFQCFSRSSLLGSSGSSEPYFDVVLPNQITPTWPRSLQHLELLYIRKWDLETAHDFFKSVWESAPFLIKLRSLIIRSSVDHDWRDRIEFRNRWVSRLQAAYHRRALPPTRYGKALAGNNGTKDSGSRCLVYVPDSSAQSKGIESRVKSLRIASTNSKVASNYAGSEATTTPPNNETPSAQPMCDVVDVRIENLRPMQNMFREEDFMDSERSGDEDWDGDDENVESGYAW